MNEQRPTVVQLLRRGITAARAGDSSTAQELLLQVIELDEENEQAWLWLSGVVDSDEDRQICLENVLAINPDNKAARKGLDHLAAAGSRKASALEPETKTVAVRREHEPLSAASAVLYPEKQAKEWPQPDDVELQQIPDVQFQQTSRFNDVWETETDICAFCAHEVAYDAYRCPNCRRSLKSSRFRYERPSSNFYIYFVLVLGSGQLFFIKMLIDLIILEPWTTVIWDGAVFVLLAAFALGNVLRKFWAFAGSLGFIVLLFGFMLIDRLTGASISDAVSSMFSDDYLLTLAESPYMTLGAPLIELLPPLQMLALLLSLFYGIFMTIPDFERVQKRLIARVDRGLREGSAFFAAGRHYAQQGMWANAVLHWQRAAAHEPNRPQYQRLLGQAYARLGFYERSLDVLRSARRISSVTETQAAIDQLIAQVEQALAQQEMQNS